MRNYLLKTEKLLGALNVALLILIALCTLLEQRVVAQRQSAEQVKPKPRLKSRVVNPVSPVTKSMEPEASTPSQTNGAATSPKIDHLPETKSSAPIRSATSADDRYLIGPGDVLDIRVYGRPQLSREAVRVDSRGMIRMPLIKEELPAACRSEADLAQEIATSYEKYLRNPYVDVFIKEYQSQPVAVIGAVAQPGRFQLQRRLRVLDLLGLAGGPTERAGGRIQIARAVGGLTCNANAQTLVANSVDSEDVLFLDLSKALRGDDDANPFVRPGDTLNIPEADQAFVVGNVFQPSTVLLKERVTVSSAIARAGGTLPDTKTDKIRIIRQVPNSQTKREIYVDLKAIDKRQAEDVALEAGDIVDVPTSTGKRFLRGLAGVIAPAAAQLPVRVVP